MQPKVRAIILSLGVSTISIWAIVIFLFFNNGQAAVTVEIHETSHIGLTETKEAAFEDERNESNRVYIIKDKTAYNSRKISNINETNDSSKVSIDTLLEELDLN